MKVNEPFKHGSFSVVREYLGSAEAHAIEDDVQGRDALMLMASRAAHQPKRHLCRQVPENGADCKTDCTILKGYRTHSMTRKSPSYRY